MYSKKLNTLIFAIGLLSIPTLIGANAVRSSKPREVVSASAVQTPPVVPLDDIKDLPPVFVPWDDMSQDMLSDVEIVTLDALATPEFLVPTVAGPLQKPTWTPKKEVVWAWSDFPRPSYWGHPGAIPEPSSWLIMILGIGMVGVVLRKGVADVRRER